MSPRPIPAVSALRTALAAEVRNLVGGTPDGTLERSRRDTGLFGPDSACWKVHGDFTSMMVGGIAALLMQMLHPGALAGVWDHSDFRRDMNGRLKRTARFIAGTTYGDQAEAQALIDRVRAIHARVEGVTPDGAPYSAQDPDLLVWVHVTEVSAFLAAYLRYVDPGFPPQEQDRYLAETAEIARRLGAAEAPRNRAELAAAIDAALPKLRYDARTATVAKALLTQSAPNARIAPALAVAFDAAKDLLPPWALRLHGFRISPVRRAAARTAIRGLGSALRWALADSAETRARRRASELAAG